MNYFQFMNALRSIDKDHETQFLPLLLQLHRFDGQAGLRRAIDEIVPAPIFYSRSEKYDLFIEETRLNPEEIYELLKVLILL